MKTINKIIFVFLFTCINSYAQDTLYIYQHGTAVIKNAINNIDSITFHNAGTTSTGNTVTDYDGNLYHTVTIGTQVWMVENLKVTHYRNGDAIPNVTDNTTWSNLTSGAYCWYNNDQVSYKNTYGAIYNWYAINDSRTISPDGWHVPSDAEWTILTTYLGGQYIAGGKLKESGIIHWNSPNEGATNESGYTALPGGNRDGAFDYIGTEGDWWSSTESSTFLAWYRHMSSLTSLMYGGYGNDFGGAGKSYGCSIRCMKN